MPESVKRRESSGPTIGAIVRLSGSVLTARESTVCGVIINVRLFAGLRERAGTDSIEVELPAGSTASDLLDAVLDITGGASCVVAINREYSGPTQQIFSGDEVALVPPVSGGSPAFVHVGPEPIDLADLAERVGDPSAGAVVTFTGVTRTVELLEYEAYAEMALTKITELAEAILARPNVFGVAAAHRTGPVTLSEASVGIAVSGAHRGDAFDAARDLIDQIKEQAPIWKVEVDGADRRRVEGNLPQT